MPFGKVWRQKIVRNPLLRGTFLAEPIIAHDQELCVLAINGGRLLVLAGRSLCMERIVRVRGHAGGATVAPSDFETPDWFAGSSIRNWRRADPETRARHTRWALTHRVEGDAAGRTISEVLLDTAEQLASCYFEGQPCAAIRVDYFVRWGRVEGGAEGDQGGARASGARVWVNEVEHGFNPASLTGWYGAELTTLAIQFWLIGNSASAREAYDASSSSSSDHGTRLQPPDDAAAGAEDAGGGGSATTADQDDRTRPATEDDFHDLLGRRVVLHGLSGRAELNGCTARVMSWHEHTGRAGVKLDRGEEKMLAIRPCNLSVVTAPDEPEAQPW